MVGGDGTAVWTPLGGERDWRRCRARADGGDEKDDLWEYRAGQPSQARTVGNDLFLLPAQPASRSPAPRHLPARA